MTDISKQTVAIQGSKESDDSQRGNVIHSPWGRQPPTAGELDRKTSPQRIAILRQLNRPYFRTLADWMFIGGISGDTAAFEATQAMHSAGSRLGLSTDEIGAATRAEWTEAMDNARVHVEKIERAVKPLIWRRAPGQAIMAAAEEAAYEAGANYTSAQLEEIIVAVGAPIVRALEKRGRHR